MGFGNHIAGELGKEKVCKRLGIKENKRVRFWTVIPVVNINHDMGFDPKVQTHRKPRGKFRAHDVPHWGRAENLIKKWV